LRAAAKMASIVTLIIEKTMKKLFKKNIISDLPTLIFSRYETGTTGIFLLRLDFRERMVPHSMININLGTRQSRLQNAFAIFSNK
jgi:hypothetical protein